jgi:carbon storage regulator
VRKTITVRQTSFLGLATPAKIRMEIMLVLTRKVGERIVLGANLEITVVRIRRRRVQLGVTAPRGVSIDRREVRQRIQGGQPEELPPDGDPLAT